MLENRILRALAPGELARLRPRLVPVELRQHEILYAMGAPMTHVYFPQSGLVSLLNINEAGDAIEAGIVSAEGVVGGVTLLDADRSISQVVVQISGRALKLPTPSFLESCKAIPRLKRLVNRHIQVLLFQAQQNAACHALHTVEGRLCRRMLQAQDITQSSVLALTQELLSYMLGAQRTSVSTIARTLQDAGFIRYRRGRIEILDKRGLEAAACECYSLVKQEIDAHLPQTVTKRLDRGPARPPRQVLSAKSS
ncbi:MAG: helix-turn-helix domain-containing protein [Rhizobiales bacterium]|nr:helix-turn-helix domain-containing protein [Hyphomicrobiales bacterium]